MLNSIILNTWSRYTLQTAKEINQYHTWASRNQSPRCRTSLTLCTASLTPSFDLFVVYDVYHCLPMLGMVNMYVFTSIKEKEILFFVIQYYMKHQLIRGKF